MMIKTILAISSLLLYALCVGVIARLVVRRRLKSFRCPWCGRNLIFNSYNVHDGWKGYCQKCGKTYKWKY